MERRTATWWTVLALAVGMLAGVAWAQDGSGHGRGGRPAECVHGRHVVRPSPPVPATVNTCRADADCVVVLAGCCAPCSTATPGQTRAVRHGQENAFRRHTCPRVVACPACAGPGPAPTTHAACVSGRCELAVDDAECGAPPPNGVGHS